MASLRQRNRRAYDAIYRQTVKGGYPADVISRVRSLGYEVSDSYIRRVVRRVRETSKIPTVTPIRGRTMRLPQPIETPRGLEVQPPKYRRRFQYFALVEVRCLDPMGLIVEDRPVQFGSDRRLTNEDVRERSESIIRRGLSQPTGQSDRYAIYQGCNDLSYEVTRLEVYDSGTPRSQTAAA